MKYVQYTIMAVLIFGVAVSPAFSNGFAFAQTEDEAGNREATREARAAEAGNREATRDARADESEQRQSSQEGRSSEAQSIREQRLAIVDEQRNRLAERMENLSEDRRQMLRDNLENLQQQASMRNSTQTHANFMNLGEEDRQSTLDEIRENRLAQREARNDMTPEDRQVIVQEKKAMMEQRENYVTPRNQISLGVPIDEIICVDGKELVVRVTSGMPICLSSDAVILLMDRGIVTYPE